MVREKDGEGPPILKTEGPCYAVVLASPPPSPLRDVNQPPAAYSFNPVTLSCFLLGVTPGEGGVVTHKDFSP